ncbi:hypothetical protein M527_12795 [Sphingobium indicum IP26]|uniref:Uncharacterized protein n=1 Tax=Sphingobium indicum F2 TaxID=1450518 RepID=A0A8E0WRZ7_9SPHN|nr:MULTISPECIES: methylamine utilization protein MauJ [Sphingobium]EPR14162.1 hypothetical protein M527_29040 [Sphingobium indicum IP26]EPR18365.1 hypothetical protein M527_12795 [Sphingobium indicum IP26]EQB03647.1 hypothetical protein L286_11515 [Sphingobium sp. HDIP04]KER36326.1 hypothetical protein AL00_11300 [Sphingobium indicum F2]
MADIEIAELKDIFVGELAEHGHWIVANLDTGISWPVEQQKYTYQDTDFFLLPITKESYPAVALKKGDETDQEARSRILRFLSAMSWSEGSGVIVPFFTGGNLPRPMGREKSFGLTITRDLNLTYLPEPAEDRGRVALALMREGRGLNHPAYAFLSFYRVLEAALPDGRARGEWVATNLERIFDRQGQEALEKLKATGVVDLGGHLYRSGRQAIAHAAAVPIINPDDASDYERLQGELPIMRGLAELAIEEVLGIKTRHTIWKEHLYELAGFKERLGPALVQGALDEIEPPEGATVDLPHIDVELRRSDPFTALKGMVPVHVSQQGKMMQLVYRSPDELVEMVFVLDFGEERLRFEWDRNIYGRDDGSAQAAIYAAELTRFIRDYVGNGELHIYDAKSRNLLSRVDAFIPTNYWANHEALNEQIMRWTEEAAHRVIAHQHEDVQEGAP